MRRRGSRPFGGGEAVGRRAGRARAGRLRVDAVPEDEGEVAAQARQQLRPEALVKPRERRRGVRALLVRELGEVVDVPVEHADRPSGPGHAGRAGRGPRERERAVLEPLRRAVGLEPVPRGARGALIEVCVARQSKTPANARVVLRRHTPEQRPAGGQTLAERQRRAGRGGHRPLRARAAAGVRSLCVDPPDLCRDDRYSYNEPCGREAGREQPVGDREARRGLGRLPAARSPDRVLRFQLGGQRRGGQGGGAPAAHRCSSRAGSRWCGGHSPGSACR